MKTTIVLVMLAIVVGAPTLTAEDHAVCVRPIYPSSTGEQQRAVANGMLKSGIKVMICGTATQPIEVWFYPLELSADGDTTFYVSTRPAGDGIAADVSSYTPHWESNQWWMVIRFGDYVAERIHGVDLESQAKTIGKRLKSRLDKMDRGAKRK